LALLVLDLKATTAGPGQFGDTQRRRLRNDRRRPGRRACTSEVPAAACEVVHSEFSRFGTSGFGLGGDDGRGFHGILNFGYRTSLGTSTVLVILTADYINTAVFCTCSGQFSANREFSAKSTGRGCRGHRGRAAAPLHGCTTPALTAGSERFERGTVEL
jgi:hypothetical protein